MGLGLKRPESSSQRCKLICCVEISNAANAQQIWLHLRELHWSRQIIICIYCSHQTAGNQKADLLIQISINTPEIELLTGWKDDCQHTTCKLCCASVVGISIAIFEKLLHEMSSGQSLSFKCLYTGWITYSKLTLVHILIIFQTS